MSITTQFYLLQYKNWKLQFRKKLTTIFEILIPVILCLLMVAIRTLVDVTPHYETTTFPAFKVDGVPEALKNRLTNPKLGLWGTGIAYTPKTNITDRIINRMKDSITAGTPGAPPFIFQGIESSTYLTNNLMFDLKSRQLHKLKIFFKHYQFSTRETIRSHKYEYKTV